MNHLGIRTDDPISDYPKMKLGDASIGSRIKGLILEGGTMLLIFAVLFVIMNFTSLKQAVFWKLNKSAENSTPTQAQKIVENSETKVQKPLPMSPTPILAQKIIPPLYFTIAPPETRLIIPRIDRNVPIIPVSSENLLKRDWNALEKDMQNALRYGVIHYPGTAHPGQKGNVVLTGHSSYFPWDPGRFKDVFALLQEVEKGDTIVMFHNQKQYIYEVDTIKIVKPSELDVLKPSSENKLTLITCTPLGTNLKRLIVEAKLKGVQS